MAEGVFAVSALERWVWLTTMKGMHSAKITKLLERFDTVDAVYEAEAYDGIEGLEPDDIAGLRNKSMAAAEKVIEDCKRFRIRILTYDSPLYPQLLAHIFDPPYVLYVRSKERIDLNESLCIAMVGNRRMSEYGEACAVELGRELAKAGVVVVSGMARGIDGAAHRGALLGGGRTVAVLGCGAEQCYPPEHYELMDAIIETGMVFSEYPPGARPLPAHFPARNRIISGLCRGTVIVEAPAKSGSLITANLALEQGRDVFAVPGNMHQLKSAGTNHLIKTGAKLVDNAFDIIEEYQEEYLSLLERAALQSAVQREEAEESALAHAAQKQTLSNDKYDGLSAEEKLIVNALSLVPMHIDELCRTTGLDAAKLSSLLTMLEMQGMVRSMPGKNFVLEL